MQGKVNLIQNKMNIWCTRETKCASHPQMSTNYMYRDNSCSFLLFLPLNLRPLTLINSQMLTHSLFRSFSGRSYSKTLQQAPLSLLPRRICQQHFHGAFTSRMLCAGSIQAERRVDSCRGDSGGPLVCERPGGGWVVYGVTSWGHACRTQQSPGVYTKVSAFSSCDGCFN